MDLRLPAALLLALTCTACVTTEAAPTIRHALVWGDCAPHATDPERRAALDRRTLQCTTLTVPLDHTKPDGRTIRLAVLRQRATEPDARLGTLVFNFGGPGASGLAQLAELGPKLATRGDELAKRFDLVAFDPRGVGASEPRLRCLTGPERDADRLRWLDGDTQEGRAAIAERNKRTARLCAERTGTEELANLGTRDVVRDLDRLREALGEPKLNYVGYSYGTRIGTVYAETYPDRVRALVLDGADAADRVPEDGPSQQDGFTEAFRRYAQDCAEQGGCPLGPDPDQAQHRLDRLTAPLRTKPLPVGARALGAEDVSGAVDHLLYREDGWPRLTEALAGLKAGDGAELLAAADELLGRRPDGGYDGSDDALTAVGCVDSPRTGTDDVCSFWPVPPTARPHPPRPDRLPTPVVISSTGDPATPHAWGLTLAGALQARLVTFEAAQHTIYLEGNPCVDRPVTSYLIGGTLPPDGLRCRP
ncbi:pimeloyl-ACP methyl ester carboxylesterase [Crossiella equi]|uniref:Pimeloyl-ACP methyl ester carboxylesterase n=1 Tax=Crossiella equi TaxID=130796 RepID=A0ABS5AA29_9PSEU|nr:alpha/beta hydrolase [Crossiella equi]MBP2473444.1 pimeloyl-ACP methyl ester carboxylesterase [Crossiella equi]